MSRITNRPTPPEVPPLSTGWRVAVAVWLCAFGALVLYELVLFAWKALRGAVGA